MREQHQYVRTDAWNEARTKALLREHGLKTPTGIVLRPQDAISQVDLPWPLAVKLCSDTTLHKTDVGGVILGVRDPAELATSVAELRHRFPGCDLLVEHMEESGVEVIVGVVRDPAFGAVIMVGLGGTLAEVYQDVTCRIVPISRADALSMLDDLHGRALIDGFRGMEVDREALLNLLLSVSRLAESLGPTLLQMDLNPVFARPADTIVVDAKALWRSA